MSLARSLTHAIRQTRPSLTLSTILQRRYTTQQTVYRNPRRLRSLSLTALAGGQATFWAYATHLSNTVPEPIVSTVWTYGGLGLSAAFASMIATYLRRSVSELALVDVQGGVGVQVKVHGMLGGGGNGVVIPARELIGGVAKDGDRYWTFARKGGSVRLYYILDTGTGVIDPDAVQALVRGGDHLMVFAHKRNAGRMRRRWEEWKDSAHG